MNRFKLFSDSLKEKGFEIYKLTSVVTNKDFIILDSNKNIIYSDCDLLKVYDFISNELPQFLVKLFCDDNELEVFSKFTKLEALEELLKFGSKKEKNYFGKFRNMLMLTIKRVYGLNFVPIKQRIIRINNIEYLNTYFPNNNFTGIKPKLNDEFLHLDKLMFNFMGNDEKVYNHWLKYLAFKLQNPAKQIPTHWVIVDNGGTGKTTFLANMILDRLFNISIISQSDLEEIYTPYLKNNQFVICEEIEAFGNVKKLKLITGSKSISIRELYKNPYVITNYNSFILFGNDIRVLNIDEQDRRFNIVGGGKRLFALNGNWEGCLFKSSSENEIFFKDLKLNLYSEIKALYSHLMALEVKETDIFNVLSTKQKDDLLFLNKTALQTFLEELSQIGLDSLAKLTLKNNYTQFIKSINYDSSLDKYYIINKNLYYLFQEYTKQGGHKVIHSNNFYKRLNLSSYFSDLFGEIKQKMIESNRYKVYELKNYNNDNKSIAPIRQNLENENIELNIEDLPK